MSDSGSKAARPKRAKAAASEKKARSRRTTSAKAEPTTVTKKPSLREDKPSLREDKASPRAKRSPRKEAKTPAVESLEAPASTAPIPGLTEEEAIESAKYLPRDAPRRVFEEERFLFPENYGIDRVRLVVRDPEWLFAYWDVKPEHFDALRRDLGERGMALSRLTLRVIDVGSGDVHDIFLPYGTRSWYVRVDSVRRAYRAELGVTLPSGEYRRLAETAPVATPRVGPSPERAGRRVSYRDAASISRLTAEAVGEAEIRSAVAESGASSWSPSGEGTRSRVVPGGPSSPGGASDIYRR